MKMFVDTFMKENYRRQLEYMGRKLKSLATIRKNQFRVLSSLKLRKRLILVILQGKQACVGSDLGTLHGYFLHEFFGRNFNFPLEYQIRLVLIVNPNWPTG